MNPADLRHDDDGASRPLARGPATDLRADEPMDAERCLFVLSLLMDGRPVPAELERRARAFAAQDVRCQATLADLAAVHGVLAGEPARTASAGFTERVLSAQRARAADGAGALLPFARRLAAAAAVVLALTLGWEASHPGQAVADPRLDLQPHAIDAFRPQAFGPVDLEAGLEQLLPGPVLAAPAGSAPAEEPADQDEGGR